MLTVYLQRNDEGEIYNDFVFSAYLGFKDNKKFRYAVNNEIKFFINIDEVPLDRNNLIVGSIENTVKFLEKLNVKVPLPINMPKELEELSARKTYYATLKEVRKYDNNKFPLFIKPIHKTDNFIAGPIKSKFDFNCFTHSFHDDLEVIISEVIEFVSEYRCFVKNGELKGIKHYVDDFTLFPNIDYIHSCIKAYKSAPSAYTLDVGITSKGETLLIECNDAWSIGSYGLDTGIYADLLFTRWNEIIKQQHER